MVLQRKGIHASLQPPTVRQPLALRVVADMGDVVARSRVGQHVGVRSFTLEVRNVDLIQQRAPGQPTRKSTRAQQTVIGSVSDHGGPAENTLIVDAGSFQLLTEDRRHVHPSWIDHKVRG